MAKKKSKSASAAKTAPESGSANKLSQLKEFFDQSKVEMKKVTWPTRKETMATSAAVIVLALVMAIFLGLVDTGLTKAIEAILS
ncbi:preprotein translocase subunit SecE [Desulfobaculum bizertense]|uniref:Protein translocase subunit SecE n=1 Tax=Desulfobaculum bizertense DSM 18034 TaxID=1121442 RepID=A0A1T4WF91_9BACT|nr:preprotein translocase subunit SecE [Desulfobaculum bizertense]UIJ36683.1 preprotein translocase subunit SecE [Desulfobaculum bizertense]SKA75950.1 protein translocase subunit secE/sec61 gamma [Desulfobaculum bizertense DSM 18034]